MKIIVSLLLAGLLFACGDKKEKKDDVIFFQVKQFFQKELEDINKTPYYIYQLSISDSTRDSTTISNTELNQYAQRFLEADINDPKMKEHYEESVFHDQTTGSFSLSYTATDKSLDLQSVNVLLNEDGETVKRIFIRKHLAANGGYIIEQLSWRPDESFEINRLTQMEGTPEKTERIIVVWNPKQ